MLKMSSQLLSLFILSLLLSARPALAFEEVNTGFFDKVALDGYDAVSYFSDSMAVEGDRQHAFEWKGATWLFSSDKNRQLFAADPEAFAPRYGGYCSNQMSLGHLSDIDPRVWRIIDGRLYLFGHEAGRVRWASETRQRIQDADGHWSNYISP